MIPQYRIEQYLNAINAAYLGESPLPEYPSEPVWRIERFLAAILSAAKGDSPVMACPDPVWHIEEFARAIYDALVGASPAWPCPTATNNIEAILHAIYKVVADGTETDGIATSWDIERWLLDSYDAAKEGGGGTETTLSGNLPLTLANALSHAIVSLTRYGLCTQDGTPTPASPVDIMCNNGALRMVDDELPSGYKRLLGISFDGNFHYKTGEYLTSDDDVTMTLDNLSLSGKNVFGSYNGANGKNFSLYIYGGTNGSYFRFGDQLKRPKYGSTGRRTITFGASGTSGFAEDSDVTPDEFTTPANTYIGMLPNSSSAAYTGDIIGSILVGTRLEWIPCESDGGVIGYYERVNGNFIAPTGDGTPVSLGYDTSHLVLRVVGDPEVLTVGGNLLSRDGETTGKIIADDGTVSDNANYCISAPFTLSAGNYVCTWKTGSGSRPFSVFAVDESGTPQSDGKLFYKQYSASGINTGEFTVAAQTRAVASYRSNTTDLAIYSPQQTATVPTLLSVGDVKDEVELIAGLLTRRVTACLYDGTQDVGDVYMSTTGGKDAGAIIVYPLATPTTEQTTAQHLNTVEGTNIVDSVANVSPLTAEVTYKANA